VLGMPAAIRMRRTGPVAVFVRPAEALPLLQRALAIYENPNLPPNNPFKAEVLENLAKVYRALGKVSEAQEAQARAAILRTQR